MPLKIPSKLFCTSLVNLYVTLNVTLSVNLSYFAKAYGQTSSPTPNTNSQLMPSTRAPETNNALDWKTRSNQLAAEFSESFGLIYPENVSAIGFRQFDEKTMIIDSSWDTKQKSFYETWSAKLQKMLETETDKNLRIDIEVLLGYVTMELKGITLEEELKKVGLSQGVNFVFDSLNEVLGANANKERNAAGVKRFIRYVEGTEALEAGAKPPLLIAMKTYAEGQITRHGKSAVFPYVREIEQYLKDAPDILPGIKSLLENSGSDAWKDHWPAFEKQVADYNNFVKTVFLPRANTTPLLAKKEYEHKLVTFGILASPQELISNARQNYIAEFRNFEALAKKVASKRKWKYSSPAQIITKLKSTPFADRKAVEEAYNTANARIEHYLQTNAIVTLPNSPLHIRFLDDAESKAQPVPVMRPPPFINNKGERPEFTVPTASKGELPFDDFSYRAAAFALVAHEGRPGHELQFSTMLDSGVSVIRSRYAFTSANVEGWALYAEDLVSQAFDTEAQLVLKQTRLWRIARAFLDPELQLGIIQSDKVLSVLTKELGVSEAMAKLDLRRYSFQIPGQAPSYFYGFQKLMRIKQDIKKSLGKNFVEKCFNDAVLSYGVLPFDILAQRLKENILCR